jgi:DNA-directed RNA polymerase specialized sigma24 family protein
MVTKPGFEDLYRIEQPKLVALGLALSGDRDTALELAQETLLKAFSNWAVVSAYDIPGAWLRRVLINLATDTNRKRDNESRAL